MLTFFSIMSLMFKIHINSLARGSLMDKEPYEEQDLIKMLVNNDYGWIEREKVVVKRQSGIYELESFNSLST